jgi:GMP synthase (glutamine-hydrolysing)
MFIVKVGTSYPGVAKRLGDFDDWVRKGLGDTPVETTVVNMLEDDGLPPVEACLGVVVTGSHAMVTDELPWSVRLTRWIPDVVRAGIPFLGICYGHQLLAHALGGKIGDHPMGQEIGTVDIELLPESRHDPLFCRLPERFPVHVAHSQTVLSLPYDSVLLAKNAFESHHAFRVGNRAWGVQFHPEYDTEVMRSYVLEEMETLTRAGHDAQKILTAVRDTKEALSLLGMFAVLVRSFRS